MDVWRKRLALIGSLVCAGICLAPAQIVQHGVWVPGLNEPMPKYWTGTLNLAAGFAVSEGGWIEDAYLYVKGAGGDWTKVNEWHNDPGDGGPMSMELKAAFDSTRFSDGQVVFVKYEVKDMVFGLFPIFKDATGFAVVHNKAFAYQHHGYLDWCPDSDGATPANTALNTMGYNSTMKSANGWHPGTVEADSYDAAMLYFNTHGVPNVWTDTNDTIPNEHVLDWRDVINGTGYPPQNSTGNPYTQFLLFDTCSTGATGSYNTWFWPFYRVDFPSVPTINQAIYGYAGTTY